MYETSWLMPWCGMVEEWYNNDLNLGVLMSEPSWLMPCCGVVEEWQFHAVDVEDIHFQIWRPVNAAAAEWKVIGDIKISGRCVFTSSHWIIH